jgi:hypothetical protein
MLKHAWLLVWGGVRQAFNLMPDFVALFLTAVGITVIFMKEGLKKLEARPHWRGFIITLFIVFGGLAFISNQIQKGQDSADKKALADQIKILVDGSQSEATSADIRSISGALKAGFDEISRELKSHDQNKSRPENPPKSPEPTPTPPTAPQSIRFTQKRVPSTDPNNPYALQVIIQSDTSVTPVGLALHFSGPIIGIRFFVAGQPVLMMTQSFVNPNDPTIGVIRFGYPALSPDSPIVISVISKAPVSLVSLDKISAAMGAPIDPM